MLRLRLMLSPPPLLSLDMDTTDTDTGTELTGEYKLLAPEDQGHFLHLAGSLWHIGGVSNIMIPPMIDSC